MTPSNPVHLNKRDLWQKHVLENLDFCKSGVSFSKQLFMLNTYTHTHLHTHAHASRVSTLIWLLKTSVLILYLMGLLVLQKESAWTSELGFLPACSALTRLPRPVRFLPHSQNETKRLLAPVRPGRTRKKQPMFYLCAVHRVSDLTLNF